MRRFVFGFVLLAMLCAGCGSTRSGRETAVAVTVAAYGTKAVTATAYVFAAQATARPILLKQLDDEEQKWNSLGIMNYRITVSKGNPFGGLQKNTITVMHGRVMTVLPTC